MQNRSNRLAVLAEGPYENSIPENTEAHLPCELKLYEINYLHFHRSVELGICLSGSGHCRVEGVMQPFCAGDVQLIFPFTHHLHKSAPNDPASWYWLYVDERALLGLIGISDTSHINREIYEKAAVSGIVDKQAFPKTAAALEQLIDYIVNETRQSRHKERIALKYYELMLTLIEESEDRPRPQLRGGRILELAPALDYISKELGNGNTVTVESLAAECGFSPASFRRIFRDSFDCSPLEYLTACKIRLAKNLLLQSQKSILEIAYLVGYNDISGFNRAFLKETGITPSEYRESSSFFVSLQAHHNDVDNR